MMKKETKLIYFLAILLIIVVIISVLIFPAKIPLIQDYPYSYENIKNKKMELLDKQTQYVSNEMTIVSKTEESEIQLKNLELFNKKKAELNYPDNPILEEHLPSVLILLEQNAQYYNLDLTIFYDLMIKKETNAATNDTPNIPETENDLQTMQSEAKNISQIVAQYQTQNSKYPLGAQISEIDSQITTFKSAKYYEIDGEALKDLMQEGTVQLTNYMISETGEIFSKKVYIENNKAYSGTFELNTKVEETVVVDTTNATKESESVNKKEVEAEEVDPNAELEKAMSEILNLQTKDITEGMNVTILPVVVQGEYEAMREYISFLEKVDFIEPGYFQIVSTGNSTTTHILIYIFSE